MSKILSLCSARSLSHAAACVLLTLVAVPRVAAAPGSTDLAVSILVFDPYRPGIVDFYVLVQNNGPQDDPALTLRVEIPPALETPHGPSGCTPSGNNLTCTIPLAAGQTSQLGFSVYAGMMGHFFLRAEVTSSLGDPKPANNVDYQSLTTANVKPRRDFIEVADVLVREGAGVRSAEFTIRSSLFDTSVVHYTTLPGTATPGADFQPVSGSLTLPGGEHTGTVAVPVLDDGLDEKPETFFLVLTAGNAATEVDLQGQATILDDDGRTVGCAPIHSVPYTIRDQGVYCLDRNLSLDPSTWIPAGITIAADYVVLDLRGFRLDLGLSYGLHYGVYGANRTNVTVRNGTIEGFLKGVFLVEDGHGGWGLRSRGHLVERINTSSIHLQGRNNVIRRNVVTTVVPIRALPDDHGIRSDGPTARIIGNSVSAVVSPNGSVTAITAVESAGSVVEGNVIAGDGAPHGIQLFASPNVLTVGNRLTRLSSGVMYDAFSSGKYRGNLTSGAATPYTGGTDAGNNQ